MKKSQETRRHLRRDEASQGDVETEETIDNKKRDNDVELRRDEKQMKRQKDKKTRQVEETRKDKLRRRDEMRRGKK